MVARRKDKDWYIGGISGETAARTVVLGLGFLETGNFNMTLISDGTSDRTFGGGTSTVSASDLPSVSLRPRGGFVAHLTPVP